MASREALQQLVDLGYIDPVDGDRDKVVADTVRELEYNLARSYMDAGLHAEAIPILEKLGARWPDQPRFGVQLATCLQAVGRFAEARVALEQAVAAAKEDATKAREEFLAFKKEQGEEFDVSKLDEKEQRKLQALRARASIDPLSVDYLMGTILMGEAQSAAALKLFNKVLRRDKTRPHVFLKVGDVLLGSNEFEKAEKAYREALALDAELPDAHLGLARVSLRQRQNLQAADSALSAIALRFHNPMAHFVLGVALHRLNVVSRALEALDLAVAQNP